MFRQSLTDPTSIIHEHSLARGLINMGTIFFLCRTTKMDKVLKILLLLAMATMTVGVDPTTRMATMTFSVASTTRRSAKGFVHHPKWGELVGEQIREDCLEALAKFPQETDGFLVLTYARVFFSGSCALGVYVTFPGPSGMNIVDETWPAIRGWAKGSINLNTGARRGGWELNMESGIQICFYEPSYVDKYRMCSMDAPYRKNHALTLATCLEIISPSRRRDPPSQPSHLDVPLRVVSGTPPSATPLRIMPSAHESGNPNAGISPYKTVPEWGGPTKIPENDCKDAILLFPDDSLWRASSSEFYMRSPEVYCFRRCAFGMFYTNPTEARRARMARAQGMEFPVEAFRLMLATAVQTPGGGFVDLPNGIQIVLYEPGVVDPQSLCAHVTSMSLKACLDGMVQFQVRQAGEGSSSRQESSPE